MNNFIKSIKNITEMELFDVIHKYFIKKKKSIDDDIFYRTRLLKFVFNLNLEVVNFTSKIDPTII